MRLDILSTSGALAETDNMRQQKLITCVSGKFPSLANSWIWQKKILDLANSDFSKFSNKSEIFRNFWTKYSRIFLPTIFFSSQWTDLNEISSNTCSSPPTYIMHFSSSVFSILFSEPCRKFARV